MKNIACFSSSGPGNFATVLDYCDSSGGLARVCALVTDRENIPAIPLARERGIEHRVFSFSQMDRDERRRSLECDLVGCYLMDVEERLGQLSLIVLAFRRILVGGIVSRYQGRMINVHPADLSVMDLGTRRPRYVGIEGLRRSLRDGLRETRSTVHFVDEGVDTGPLVCLGPTVPVDSSLDEHEHERRQKLVSDRPALLKALDMLLKGEFHAPHFL